MRFYKFILYIIISLAAFVLLYYGVLYDNSKPYRLYNEAINASADNNIDAAEHDFKIIIKRYPNNPYRKNALYQLALLDYLYLKDYPAALEHFYDLVYTYPHYDRTFNAYMYIADIYKEHQNSPDKAIEIYEKLLQITDSHENEKLIFPKLAETYERIGDISKAIGCYERLIKIFNKPPAHYVYELAYLKYLKGLYTEAITNFQMVCSLYPDSKYAFHATLGIADCYEETGRSVDALSLLEHLKTNSPIETTVLNIKIDSIKKRLSNKAIK
ncbi:MAG: tetratricopeptide repeat protein [Deltaproteobacteria bacterium]|nr:tetratricopeptide repeat protein [Deltaproteobacteria bacterium]MCL5792457.1 tetratricopeptide repeat protein [Deltaproteobacteria bacterium]